MRLAAALEAGATHPLAQALRDAARALPAAAATGIVLTAGRGVEGTVDGRELRLGSRGFAGEWLAGAPLAVGAREGAGAAASPGGREPGAGRDEGGSEAWLVERGRVLARFELADALRDDARAAVDALRDAGLVVRLLSGDRPETVAAVARELGIEDWRAGATPADKLDAVKALQREGRIVLMVGDGINDAPVLAAADASLAVGAASALARTAADTVLLSPELALVPALARIARKTRRVIAENLAWATLYNLVAIPAAALGWVPPWLAAVGMSTSSLLVVANALRLRLPARKGA
ncbi:MAG: HAD-IC family P-type ATPase [Burkholderiaceae bacterium]